MSAAQQIACRHCKSNAHDSDRCRWPSMVGLSPAEAARQCVEGLPTREREVLRWIASDLPADSIAQVMGVSRHTVHHYRKALYARLGVGSAVGATLIAMRAGLVS